MLMVFVNMVGVVGVVCMVLLRCWVFCECVGCEVLMVLFIYSVWCVDIHVDVFL